MEKKQFLQQPGGLGPQQNLQPLGGFGSTPQSLVVTPTTVEIRRVMATDDINRVYAQRQVDVGDYSRAPVGPTNYQPGNIMPSQEMTGVAGYNHNGQMVLPEKPADMNKADYLVKESNEYSPEMRMQMQMQTMLPQQNFLNTQDVQAKLPVNYMMPDSLYLQMPMEKRGE